jgi:hypothetical protein
MSTDQVPGVEHLLGIAKMTPTTPKQIESDNDVPGGEQSPFERRASEKMSSEVPNLPTPFTYNLPTPFRHNLPTPFAHCFDVPVANTVTPGLFPNTPMLYSLSPVNLDIHALPSPPLAGSSDDMLQSGKAPKIDGDGLFAGNGMTGHAQVSNFDAGAGGPDARDIGDAPGIPEDDVDLENILSINLLLEFEPGVTTFHPVDWNCVDVTMIVIKKFTNYTNPKFPFHTTYDAPPGFAKPVVYVAQETLYIERDGSASSVMQKSIDIVVPRPADGKQETCFFDINLIFKEQSITLSDWIITTSCYIALQSARKVLFPIRCHFSRSLVDVTGAKPTFYCSFAVKRSQHNPRDQAAYPLVAEVPVHDELTHLSPTRERVTRELSSNRSNSSGDNNNDDAEMGVPDKATLRECSSHGMRPIGPHGRLMTAEQRRTFASIQKRFAKTPCRERKSALLNADLYPLFTLGRDECCKEMGTCATWLKHRMRERGIKVWPNRRLIPTTSSLYRLKQQYATILDGTAGPPDENSPKGVNQQARLLGLEKEIAALRQDRMEIVRDCCTPEFFAEFEANASPTILDPDWEK